MPVTTNYAIPYPDGTSQLTPLQTWFQQVAEGVDAALVAGLSTSVPVGTTAQRDTFWGVPATAAARVLLASKPARWLNTDKGWEEQYFAATADAGSGRYSRTSAGWFPSIGAGGLVPIRPSSIANTGGSAVIDGGGASFSAVTALSLNGVFSGDFSAYKVIMSMTGTAASLASLLLRSAGVDNVSASYSYQGLSGIGASPAGAGAVLTVTTGHPTMNAGFLDRGDVENNIYDPAAATPTRFVSTGYGVSGSSQVTSVMGGIHNVSTAFDGITLKPSAGTLSGTMRVYGINNY